MLTIVLNNKTFRVFVSSTFSDLKEERNALQREVFPKLRELCMEHGFRFQAIDLRWGVSEEAGLDQQTMKICLEEIERSQRVSPKPNFIVLLGDRYGWRPLPYEIPADEFEEIKSVITGKEDGRFLFWEGEILEDEQLKKREGWYCRNENAVPPVYCLKPRLVDYDEDASDDEIKEARDLEYKDWENAEKRLKSILLNAIDKLDWNKEDPRRFKYESSATEQEIIKGVLNLPEDGSLSEEHVFSFIRKIRNKKSIPFDHNSKDFFDFTTSGTIDVSAEEKLIVLKDKIDDKLPSSNIFDFESEWEGNGVSKQHIKKLCDDVYSSLKKVINEEINEFEDKDPLDMEIEAHKEFGKERCKFFIGREDNRAQFKNYLETPNPKPLIVYGESGSGKSALMARAVEDLRPDFYEISANNVIVRFIGTTPESSNIRSLLESLSRQITEIYGEDDSNIPTEYNELVQYFTERLNFATVEKPLFIFLDALDQLSDSDNAHNITWIPDELPENVHIVISTLKNIFESSLEPQVDVENTVEVLPLEDNDGRAILDAWLKDYKRKLTDNQETEVIDKFEVEGLPLYLKLAFEEAKLWKSYTPVPELESDIKWMINYLFERLLRPENHGEMLVSRSLGYLSAAKNGLTEDEMLDILALDDDVFSLTKKFHEPSEDRLPVALWSRFYFDLEPYLAERSADETSLMGFYHRQLGEVAREKYLDNTVKKSRHQVIAEYFYKQDLFFDKDEENVYNVRKVSELPYQEAYGECWKHLEKSLCDLRFVEAKCAVGKTYELIKDYKLALDIHPDAQEEKKKKLEHEKRVAKYVNDLIAYSKGEIDHLDIIPSVKPWTQEKISEDNERIINNPTILDSLKAFSQFVNSNNHVLVKFGHYPSFCFQQAYKSANGGPVKEKANKILKNIKNPMALSDDVWLPKFTAHPSLIKTFEGHTDFRMEVAITPDGKTAITGSDDFTVHVWDLETGKNTKKLKHDTEIETVEVTPDGKTAITGNGDKTVHVWDLETGKNTKTITDLPKKVKKMAITPDGKTAITVSYDKTAHVWDLETGKNTKKLKHDTEIETVEVTPDGKTAITGNGDKTVHVWDLETGKNTKKLKVHSGKINGIAITPDGKKAITANYEKSSGHIETISSDIRLWDLETGKNTKKLKGHSGKINGIAITPDAKKAITCSNDKTVRVWDLETGKNTKKLKGHTDNVWALAVTPDAKKAITRSYDKTVRVWDLETGENTKKLKNHTHKITGVALTPDGKKVVTGDDKNGLMWDLKTGENLQILEGHTEMIRGVVITPDAKKAITCSNDKTVRVWDLETGKNTKKLKDHLDIVLSLAVTPDGKTAITGSSDNTLRLWDLETGETLQILEGHKDSVWAVAFTYDGKKAVTGSWDKTLCLWDLETGENLKKLKDTDKIFAVSVTPDGKTAITTSNELSPRWDHLTNSIHSNVRVWDLETGKNTKKLKGHTLMVNTVSITPDGKTAITGGDDKTVRVWNLETGKMIFLCYEDYPISYLTVKGDKIFVFGKLGDNIDCLHLVNMESRTVLITAYRMWLSGGINSHGSWDHYIKADCQWCGKRFCVPNEFINNIREVENQYQKPDGWVAGEAWEDTRLFSECPECHKKIKFNPSIVDNSEVYFDLKKSSNYDLNEENPVVKKETTKEKKKSRWKFWK